MPDELLQRFQQAEVRTGGAGAGIELDQEIEIAVLGAKGSGGNRAENLQAADTKPPANTLQVSPALSDFRDHASYPFGFAPVGLPSNSGLRF